MLSKNNMRFTIETKLTLLFLTIVIVTSVLYSVVSVGFLKSEIQGDEKDEQPLKDKANDLVKSLLKSLFLIALSLIILFLPLIIFLSHLISEPLKKLAEATDEVSRGNLDVKIDVKTKDEIGNLAATFNSMTVKIKNLERAKRAEKSEKELKALEQGYKSKLISKSSYEKNKERIEKKLQLFKK